MAAGDDVLDALEGNIQALGRKAAEAQAPTHAAKYALAAMHLAEARAWIMSPNQPHGGSESVGE